MHYMQTLYQALSLSTLPALSCTMLSVVIVRFQFFLAFAENYLRTAALQIDLSYIVCQPTMHDVLVFQTQYRHIKHLTSRV